MSFTEAKREAIKKYMLDKIREDDKEFVAKVSENFEISATSVKRYIADCLNQEIICRDDEKACGYCLRTLKKEWELCNEGMLEEDDFYFDEILPFLKDTSKNAQDIWYYAFTEMMNNAIEHSEGNKIKCRICQDYLYTEISIKDNGVGIYKNICAYMKEKYGVSLNVRQAAAELYKGKLTTRPESHSGEGIFFTSKFLVSMAIWSEGTVYTYRCNEEDQFINTHLLAYLTGLSEMGTMVVMKLENDTKRMAREVLDMFAPLEEGFVKTLIPMKEMCPLGDPIARSQARRILRRLEEFEEIIFDFAGIEFMGQGFADEVFRVFQNRNPEIVLTAVNANETVLGMIKHVKR